MNTTAVLIIMAVDRFFERCVDIDHIHFADMASCEAARDAILEENDGDCVQAFCAPGGIPAGR